VTLIPTAAAISAEQNSFWALDAKSFFQMRP